MDAKVAQLKIERYKMSERLVVNLNDTYLDMKLISTAQIWNGKAKLSEWITDDPRALLHQAIEQVEPDVFEQIKIKKMLEKAATLFEATKVTIQGK